MTNVCAARWFGVGGLAMTVLSASAIAGGVWASKGSEESAVDGVWVAEAPVAPLASLASGVAQGATKKEARAGEERVIVLSGEDGERVRIVISPEGGASIETEDDAEGRFEIKSEGDRLMIIDADSGRRIFSGEIGEGMISFSGRASDADAEGGRFVLRGDGKATPSPDADADGEGTTIFVRPRRIGITMSPLGEAVAAQLRLEKDAGVLVTGVLEGLPAKKAGVQRYDVIVSVNGEEPATLERVRTAVLRSEPGEAVTLKVIRAGEEKKIDVRVEAIEGRGGSGEARREKRPAEQVERRVLEKMLEEGNVVRLRELMESEAIEEALRAAERAGSIAGREIDRIDWGRIQEQIERELKSAQLDEETRRTVKKAMSRVREELRSVEKQVTATLRRELGEQKQIEAEIRTLLERLQTDLPQVRFFGDVDAVLEKDGGALILRPDAALAPSPDLRVSPEHRKRGEQGVRLRREKGETDEVSSRLTRLEERMSRLEKLLERLVEDRR